MRMFTVKKTCDLTGLGVTSIYSLLGQGKLRAKKAGARTLVTGESLAAYLASLPDAVITTGSRRPG